jgi:hypothetical protein
LDSIITHLKKYILTLSVIFISSLANSQPWNANIKTENPTFFLIIKMLLMNIGKVVSPEKVKVTNNLNAGNGFGNNG